MGTGFPCSALCQAPTGSPWGARRSHPVALAPVRGVPGVGLDPGRQAANRRWEDWDTDGGNYLSGYSFEVTFTDGAVRTFAYDADMLKELGSLYQKWQYFSSTPTESWNRPVDYYEFVETVSVPALSAPLRWILAVLIPAVAALLIRARSH